MKKYDAVVIGSGQGGTPLARKLADAGYKTALIERRWIGGTCVNDGCTPTKAMIASAKTIHTIQNSNPLGVDVGQYKIDIAKIVSRQQGIVNSFREGSANNLASTDNLDVLYGEASFTGRKEIRISFDDNRSEAITSDLIFIDTGTSPSAPQIEGLDTIAFLTSTTILELKELPEHLLIIGSGYVGMEFAQMYRRFGSAITLLERSDRILRKEDEDIASEIYKIFRDENIDIKLNASAIRFQQDSSQIKVTLKIENREETLSCSHVLVATGRKPNTDKLNLSAAGVAANEKGFIKVDNQLQTNVAGIYALGDVKGGPAFTHISYHDHLIIYNNLVHHQDQNTDHRLVPYCMYIDPQFGRVGINEQEARAKNLDVQLATLPMTKVARAIETGDTRGVMKAIVDSKTKKILGASILGAEAGEIMSALEIAMMGDLTYETIRDAIFAHPTYSESLNNLFATLDGE